MTPAAGWYLGVDAGNSKTVAVVADTRGTILGYGRAGRGDIYDPAGESHAVGEVRAALDAALAAAAGRTGSSGPVLHTAFCLAGIDWGRDLEYWETTLRGELNWPGSWSIRNDGFALLRAGAPSGVGVALSAGTGAAVAGRGPESGGGSASEWSASWWITHPIGGHALGSEALDAVVRAELGLGERTALTGALLETYGRPHVSDLLEAFTGRQGLGMTGFARAARTVLDVAGRGDPVARRIVEGQGRWYAAYAEVAADRVGIDTSATFDVVLGGSVLRSERPELREATIAALAERLPAAVAVVADRPPALGALLQGLAEGLGGLPDDVLARVDEQPLPADLFLT